MWETFIDLISSLYFYLLSHCKIWKNADWFQIKLIFYLGRHCKMWEMYINLKPSLYLILWCIARCDKLISWQALYFILVGIVRCEKCTLISNFIFILYLVLYCILYLNLFYFISREALLDVRNVHWFQTKLYILFYLVRRCKMWEMYIDFKPSFIIDLMRNCKMWGIVRCGKCTLISNQAHIYLILLDIAKYGKSTLISNQGVYFIWSC